MSFLQRQESNQSIIKYLRKLAPCLHRDDVKSKLSMTNPQTMSKITAKTKQCIIIGDPVGHSMSPTLHNLAYEQINIDGEFVFTAANVKPEGLKDFIAGVRATGIVGVTVTVPHKTEVMKYLDEIDPIAKKIGAVNTIVNQNGKLKGYNTDWLGTIIPLANELNEGDTKSNFLNGKKVAILGAGGAARAMAFGVKEKGAEIVIFNRTVSKAQELAGELEGEVHSLEDIEKVREADIIINSSSVGMGKLKDLTLVPIEHLRNNQLVFDAVYSPHKTRLLREAKQKDAKIIHGVEMFLYQAVPQFELQTDHKAPFETMRQFLLSRTK